jgi:hypothetical protein
MLKVTRPYAPAGEESAAEGIACASDIDHWCAWRCELKHSRCGRNQRSVGPHAQHDDARSTIEQELGHHFWVGAPQ